MIFFFVCLGIYVVLFFFVVVEDDIKVLDVCFIGILVKGWIVLFEFIV